VGNCHPPNIRKSISILFKSHTTHIDQEKNEDGSRVIISFFLGHRSQVTGHRSQVTGHRSQVTGHSHIYWSQVINIHAINGCDESSNAEGSTRLSVIRGAVVTQKACVCGVVPNDEVGTVVKTGITVATEAELVLVTLRIAFFNGKFDAW